MSKVSDKDLKHLLVLQDCFGRGHEVAKAVYDELLALRKVSDAAVRWRDGDVENVTDMGAEILKALREAGR